MKFVTKVKDSLLLVSSQINKRSRAIWERPHDMIKIKVVSNTDWFKSYTNGNRQFVFEKIQNRGNVLTLLRECIVTHGRKASGLKPRPTCFCLQRA